MSEKWFLVRGLMQYLGRNLAQMGGKLERPCARLFGGVLKPVQCPTSPLGAGF